MGEWIARARLDDAAWWTQILRAHGLPAGIQVTNVERARLGDAPGASSNVDRVQLTYSGPADPAPAVVIVKRSGLAEMSEDIKASLPPMWRNEAGFYSQIASKIDTVSPNCWYSEASDDGQSGVLVLQDLSDWAASDQHEGLTSAELDAAIMAIAPMHAWSWDADTRQELAWVDFNTYLMAANLPAMWPGARPVIERKHPGFARMGDEIYPLFSRVLEVSAERVHCLVHGDFRGDNLRMRGSDGSGYEVAVFDFANLFRGVGAHDIARLMAGSPRMQPTLEDHKRACELWRTELLARGVEGYSRDDAWFDYMLGMTIATEFSTLVDLVEMGDEHNRETFNRMSTRIHAAALVCGVVDFARGL